MKKVFVFDLDDTLLNRNKKIGKNSEAELFRQIECGNELIFATSRPLRSVKRYVNHKLLRNVTIISLNGAICHHKDGNISQFSHIGDRAKDLINHREIQQDTHFFIELSGNTFASNYTYDKHTLWELHSATDDMVISCDDVNYEYVSKVAIDGDGKSIVNTFLPIIESYNLKGIPCLDNTFINVVDPHVDKSSTLEYVLDTLRISKDNTFVFGDDIPDVEMMKIAGVSIAMANAKESVKEVADYIIGDCDDDCIGTFIQKF